MSVRPHEKQKSDPRYLQTWVIDYKSTTGKRRQELFDGSEQDAYALERSYRMRGRTPSIRLFPSLLEVFPLFKAHYQLDHQPQGYERLLYSFKQLLPYFGRYQFQSLTAPLIEGYKRIRLESVKPTTVNKELAALSSLCKWASEMGYCEPINTIRRFPNKMTKAPLQDIPSRKNILLLLRAIPRKKRPAFACMYYLGLRSQEVRDLKPESVFWDMGILSVVGKGNKNRPVPINRKAKPYLRNSLPFYAPGDFRQILKWAAKRVGQEEVNPHLFRHCFAVHMVSRGVGIRPLQLMLGHSNSSTTERYAQVFAETLKNEMGKF